jgi:hypothetical protein
MNTAGARRGYRLHCLLTSASYLNEVAAIGRWLKVPAHSVQLIRLSSNRFHLSHQVLQQVHSLAGLVVLSPVAAGNRAGIDWLHVTFNILNYACCWPGCPAAH